MRRFGAPAAYADTGVELDESLHATGRKGRVTRRLVSTHRRSHGLWNKRDLESFIPTFAPTIHYLEVPKGHQVTNSAEMIDFASKWFKAAPDAKISGVYWYAGRIRRPQTLGRAPSSVHRSLRKDRWTIAQMTLAGTQTGPLPSGAPPTNKRFSIHVTEFISWRRMPPAPKSLIPPSKATGGTVYYDVLSLMKQLGHTEPPGLPAPI